MSIIAESYSRTSGWKCSSATKCNVSHISLFLFKLEYCKAQVFCRGFFDHLLRYRNWSLFLMIRVAASACFSTSADFMFLVIRVVVNGTKQFLQHKLLRFGLKCIVKRRMCNHLLLYYHFNKQTAPTAVLICFRNYVFAFFDSIKSGTKRMKLDRDVEWNGDKEHYDSETGRRYSYKRSDYSRFLPTKDTTLPNSLRSLLTAKSYWKILRIGRDPDSTA